MTETDFCRLLLTGTPVIDVRAPIEFAQGSIPGSINLPILSDQERALVGTVYKQQGSEQAIALGHELVRSQIKEERIEAWAQIARPRPEAVIMCFRGGLRSQIAQKWLAEKGIKLSRIQGGYKELRRFLIGATDEFSRHQKLTVISGATGSGKTLLIQSLEPHRRICDLEKLANHRGSAFGGFPEGQPGAVDFENRLALRLLQLHSVEDSHSVLIEDESRLIGRCVQPLTLFEHLRNSPVVVIEEDLASRVETTFNDYILGSPLGQKNLPAGLMTMKTYRESLRRIAKKLGGERWQEVSSDLEHSIRQFTEHLDVSSNRTWIEKLLVFYYDPMYLGSLQKRNPPVIYRGSRKQCFEFLKNFGDAVPR